MFANPVNITATLISALVIVAGLIYVITSPRMVLLAVKNLRRNLVRTILTGLVIMVLVAMVTIIWSVMSFMDSLMQEKSADFKLILSERWMLPSQMPATHADYLNPESPKFLPELKGLYGPKDFMTWSFYGGSTDPAKMSLETMAFFFALEPKSMRSMMDDLENLDPALVEKLQQKRDGVLMGKERLDTLNLKVGNRFKVTSFNYKGVDLEFEVVGELPKGRYDRSGIMNASYFNGALDKYATDKRVRHPLDQKRLNYIWLRVADKDTFNKVGEIIENTPYFADIPVKVETGSSGLAAFFDAYRDIFWGIKYLLVPAMLAIMALVVANAISISVRERRPEMAVLKVLGFRPYQILFLVLGESLFIGCLSGLLSAGLTYAIIGLRGGISFPIGFFPAFPVPAVAFFWGLAMGAGTAFLGSFLPALSARSVKVSEVFSKVA